MSPFQPPAPAGPAPEGARERKRRETRARIAEAGLRLFLVNGFDGTTLDAIASEAGIARRSFFAYFKSKDDVVLFWQQAGWDSLCAELLTASPDLRPLDAVREVIVKQMARYSGDELIAFDRLIRSSESLLARKNTFYAEQEQALFATLCQVWRQPERRVGLRMVAVVAIGAMKLTTQSWGEQTGERTPMADLFRQALDSLAREIADDG